TPLSLHVWSVLMSVQVVAPGEHMPTQEATIVVEFTTHAWLVQPVDWNVPPLSHVCRVCLSRQFVAPGEHMPPHMLLPIGQAFVHVLVLWNCPLLSHVCRVL